MRVTLYGPPPTDVDQLAGEYADLMADTIHRTLHLTAELSRNPVPTQDDLAVLPGLWRAQVEDRLTPTLALLWLVGQATFRLQLDEAYGLTAAGAASLEAVNKLILGYTDEQLAEKYLTEAQGSMLSSAVWIWAHARDKIIEGIKNREGWERIAERLEEAEEISRPRAQALARNEVHDALQYASYAQALALGLPGTKEWVAILDDRVRPDHRHADGQRVGIRERFDVGGWKMDRPHDLGAPPEETANCRCTLRFDFDLPDGDPAGGKEATIGRRRRADQRLLRRAYTRGVVKRGINKDQLEEALRSLSDFPLEIGIDKVIESGEAAQEVLLQAQEAAEEIRRAAEEGAIEASGRPELDWFALAAAADTKTGAMIALLPDQPEALELQSDEAEPAADLHLTLAYLGDGADWTAEQRDALLDRLSILAGGPPLDAEPFGAAHWNTADDGDPSWVLNVAGDTLPVLHLLVWDILRDGEADALFPELPEQHEPWIPHICLAYSADQQLLPQMSERVGRPLRFSALRVAFAGEITDLKLDGEPPAGPVDATAALTDAARAYRQAFHPGHPDQKVHGHRGPGSAGSPGDYGDLHIGGGRPKLEEGPYPGVNSFAGLTDTENLALYAYQHDDLTKAVNGRLRAGGKTTGPIGDWHPEAGTVTDQELIPTLDAAIAKGTLQKDVLLHRGVALDDRTAERLTPGATITDRAYLSTSFGETHARFFAGYRSDPALGGRAGSRPYLLKITAPKGTHAAPGSLAMEEVILPRDLTLEVTGRDGEVIHARIRP